MDPVSALTLVANVFGVIPSAEDVVALASQIHDPEKGVQLHRQERARIREYA